MTQTEPINLMRRSGGRHVAGLALIIVAAALLYLAGNASVHLWDRDEAWYCQTSKQMVQSGDWLVPRFLDRLRTAKPILIYWLQSASMSIFGTSEFAARLVSAVSMTTTLIILAIALSRATGARRAMWTVLIFSTSAMVIASAKMCLIDSAMLVLITGMQICVYRLYRASGVRRPPGWDLAQATAQTSGEPAVWTAVVMWILAGLAVLAKGPVPLVIILSSMTMLALLDVGRQWRSPAAWGRALRWWRWTRPLMGVGIVLLIAGPWAIAVHLREPRFLPQLLWEPGRHLTQSESGHMPVPGYFVLTIWLTYFPWSLFLPAALVLGFRHRRTPLIRYALAIVLGNWVFSEMMVTKLPHYLLPSYSAMALLTATALIRYRRHPRHKDLHTLAYKLGVGVWSIGGLLLAGMPWLAVFWFKDFSFVAAGAFTAAGVVYVAIASALLFRRRLGLAGAVMGLGMIVMIGVLYTVYLPLADFLRLPVRAGLVLRELGATGEGQVIMTGYDEPSLAYYQGGSIRARDKRYLGQSPPEDWPLWIVTTRHYFDRLPERRRQRLELVRQLRGMNYNTSQAVTELVILRNREAPRSTQP